MRSKPSIRSLRAAAERGAGEPPHRVAREADRERDQHRPAEWLVRERAHGALLVGRLAAAADRELQRQEADDPVDEAARDEPGAGEPLERPAVDEVARGFVVAVGVEIDIVGSSLSRSGRARNLWSEI